MAIVTGVEVNWRLSPRVITIPAPVTEVTIEDLQDTLLALEDDDEGMLWPHLRNTSGGEALGGGTTVGWTMELQNAQVAFEARTTYASTGTVTTADATGRVLIDSAATFITDGVEAGASVVNDTDNSVTTVLSVDSETQLTMYSLKSGTDNQWDSADQYQIWNEVQCEVSGGNIVAVDDVGTTISPIFPTFGTQVLRTSSASATNQQLADIQYSSFGNGVTIDALSSYSGTEYPVGTPRQPVNNVPDAVTIATLRGFTSLYILGDLTFDTGDVIDGYKVIGESPDNSSLTVNAGASTVQTRFEGCTIQGILDGGSTLVECHIGNLNFVDGSLHDCQFNATITLSGVNDMVGISCHSGVVGGATPTIDFGGAGSGLILRNYSGGIELINKTGAEEVSIDLDSGQIKIQSSVTGGSLYCRGVGKLINNAGVGATIVEEILDSRNLNKSLFTNGCVYLDSTSAETGTAFPLGTNGRPVSSLADALTICANNGLNCISLTGFFTATGAHNLDGIDIVGGSGSSNVLILAGASTSTSAFSRLIVTGAFDGLARIHNCVLGTTGLGGVTGIEGRIVDCIINHTDGIIQNPTGAGTLFDNCAFTAPLDPQITIDANGKGFGLRACTGNILVTNATVAEAQQIHIAGARIEFANSCTAGSFDLSGNGVLTDNTAGTTLTNNLMSTAGAVADAVWDEAAADHLTSGSTGEKLDKIDRGVKSIPAFL